MKRVYSLLLFLLLFSSNLEAKESDSLKLRGFMPYYFSLEYKLTGEEINFSNKSNFDFYGEIESLGQIIRFNGPIKLVNNLKTQIVTVKIN